MSGTINSRSARVPRVVVGLPTYNGARYLTETLEGWLAQEFTDFELIASDNASTDETSGILADYARRDSRIRVLRRDTNVRSAENFNGLVPHAHAPYFIWSADDDMRVPSFLARLVEALDADSDAVLAYPCVQFLKEEAPEVSPRVYYAEDPPGSEATPVQRAIGLLRRARSWGLTYGLIRTDALRRTQLFHSPMGLVADVGLMLELSTQGRFVNVPEVLLRLRIHSRSQSSQQDDPMYAGGAGKILDERTRRYIQAFPMPPRERQILLKELAIWCRKGRKPRPLWLRIPGARSAYVALGRTLVDLRVAAAVR